ncbi:MAG: hypothetical protein IPN57_08080 [Ignavibacteria bacterium]|nr:hypothetical protein [Ignavibacteria bacterium]
MRIKITFKQAKPDQLIPINYQYPLHSFIYHTIERSDSQYSKWLHNSGLLSGNKKFKYFTFSKLNIPDSGITDLYGKKYINIKSDRFEMTVSMMSEKTVEHFIIGMFEKQRVKIYDGNIESEFFINTVEMVPEPEFRSEMTFKTISPVVLSRNTFYNGKESQEYISPADKEYAGYFIKNLMEKYITLFQSRQASETGNANNINTEESQTRTFEQTGDYKSKLITIKRRNSGRKQSKGIFLHIQINRRSGHLKDGIRGGIRKAVQSGIRVCGSFKETSLSKIYFQNMTKVIVLIK